MKITQIGDLSQTLLAFLSRILTCRSDEFNLKALWYLAVDSTHLILHFPLLVRRSGTHYLMNAEIRRGVWSW